MNVSAAVPGGVVVFFCSYAYEKTVVNTWRADGTLDRLEQKKKVILVRLLPDAVLTLTAMQIFREASKLKKGSKGVFGLYSDYLESTVGQQVRLQPCHSCKEVDRRRRGRGEREIYIYIHICIC